MTTWMKKPLHWLWAVMQPLRRPLARKIQDNLDRSLAPVVQNLVLLQQSVAEHSRQLQRIDDRQAAAQARFRDDLAPTLDGVMRDLARLQVQIELLQEAVSDNKGVRTPDHLHLA
jgi:prefoldin subunit 5